MPVLYFADHLPVFTQPDVEKWPEPENGMVNGSKEVLCISKYAVLYGLKCLLFFVTVKRTVFLVHSGLMHCCGFLCSTKLASMDKYRDTIEI